MKNTILYHSEILGIVESANAPIYRGKDNIYKIFKFVLKNDTGSKIQVTTWGDEIIDKIIPFIIPNRVSKTAFLIFSNQQSQTIIK